MFQTTEGTILDSVHTQGSKFKEFLLKPPVDNDGNIFVDRNPVVFTVLLDFLRN
eukprot:gene10238-19098_t